MKRILFVTSLYSGLRNSIIEGKWQPLGMPAVYKLLERLENKNIPFDYVFVTNLYSVKDNDIMFDRFYESKFIIVRKINSRILKGFIKDYFLFRKLYFKINEELNFANYETVYIDRANIGLIPFIIKKFNGKIILRLHGVGELLNKYSGIFSMLKYGFKKHSFNQKIDTVICTEDGTPGREFILKYMKNVIRAFTLPNGVDIISSTNSISKQNHSLPLNLLFIGRLELDKGILELIEFIEIMQDLGDLIKINIAGNGKYEKEIKSLASKYSYVVYYGTILHSEITSLYSKSDIYISLNKLGNLSNTTLEAINHGLGIITLSPDKKMHKDIDTAFFLGENVYYADRDNIARSLKQIIQRLIYYIGSDQEKSKISENLKPKLKSWNDRLDFEISLMTEK